MRYIFAVLLVSAVSGCADHHELTACQGPYNSLTPPPPALPKPAGAQTQAAR